MTLLPTATSCESCVIIFLSLNLKHEHLLSLASHSQLPTLWFAVVFQKNWLCASQDDSLLQLTAPAELTTGATTTLPPGFNSNMYTHSFMSQLLFFFFFSLCYIPLLQRTNEWNYRKWCGSKALPVDNGSWLYNHSVLRDSITTKFEFVAYDSTSLWTALKYNLPGRH